MTQITVQEKDYRKKEQVNSLLTQALEREKRLLRSALAKTWSQLQNLEKKYSLTSVQFFTRYQEGNLDDRDDYVDWAGEYKLYLSLTQQLASLEDTVLCS